MAGTHHEAWFIWVQHRNSAHGAFDQPFTAELSAHSCKVSDDVRRNNDVVENNWWHRCFFDFFDDFSSTDEATTETFNFSCKASDFHFSFRIDRGIFFGGFFWFSRYNFCFWRNCTIFCHFGFCGFRCLCFLGR